MANRTIDISNAFKAKDVISKVELAAYIRSIDSNATDDSIRQRIARCKRTGLIISLKKNLYALSQKPVYKHPSDKFIEKLARFFSSQFPEINYCVWSSAWLYDFTVHQPSRFFYVFETETDMVETAFNLLKDNGYKVFLNPDDQTMQLYVMDQKKPVVVKQLMSRAPLVKSKTLRLPSFEKMLTDAYFDKNLFYFIQGKEMENIFKFSFDKYSINLSRLLNYAIRRGIEKELKDFIIKNIPNLIGVLNND